LGAPAPREFVVVDGVSLAVHPPFLEDPDAFNAAFSTFVSTLQQPR
jgi:hypothetical protein